MVLHVPDTRAAAAGRRPTVHDILLGAVALILGVTIALVVGLPELGPASLDVQPDPAGFLAP